MAPSSLRDATSTRQHTQPQAYLRWDTWRAWVLANLIAEALGLGATMLIWLLVLGKLESRIGIVPVAFLVVMLGALCEGTIVGGLQWLVLRRPLPAIRWRVWAAATAVGAGVAWALGMLPNVAMSFAPASSPADSGQTFDMATMPEMLTLLLAALLGIVLGATLGTAQWVVLRKHVPRAGWWIPANALARALGMALVFAGMNFIPDRGAIPPGIIALLIIWLALAGTLVGALHGLALIWLLRERDRAPLASVAVTFT